MFIMILGHTSALSKLNLYRWLRFSILILAIFPVFFFKFCHKSHSHFALHFGSCHGSTNICLIYLALKIRERGKIVRHYSQMTIARNHFVFEWNIAEGFRSLSCFWCRWGNMFHLIPFTGFVILTFFFVPEAFSTSCPILLLTFETSVRLSWLKKTSPFKSVIDAKLNPAKLLCVIALCLWGRTMILKPHMLLNVTSVVAAGNFNSETTAKQICITKWCIRFYLFIYFLQLLSNLLYPRWHGAYES